MTLFLQVSQEIPSFILILSPNLNANRSSHWIESKS